jgi:hypothetical protein
MRSQELSKLSANVKTWVTSIEALHTSVADGKGDYSASLRQTLAIAIEVPSGIEKLPAGGSDGVNPILTKQGAAITPADAGTFPSHRGTVLSPETMNSFNSKYINPNGDSSVLMSTLSSDGNVPITGHDVVNKPMAAAGVAVGAAGVASLVTKLGMFAQGLGIFGAIAGAVLCILPFTMKGTYYSLIWI